MNNSQKRYFHTNGGAWNASIHVIGYCAAG